MFYSLSISHHVTFLTSDAQGRETGVSVVNANIDIILNTHCNFNNALHNFTVICFRKHLVNLWMILIRVVIKIGRRAVASKFSNFIFPITYCNWRMKNLHFETTTTFVFYCTIASRLIDGMYTLVDGII